MSAGKIEDNFGVVNADDCYGRDAFMKLAAYLKDAKDGEKAQVLVNHTLKDVNVKIGGKEIVVPAYLDEKLLSEILEIKVKEELWKAH